MKFEQSAGPGRPLRITIVLGPFLPAPPAPCGAVEFLWAGLCEEFVRQGHDVTVLCRGHETQQPTEVVRGVRYIRRTRFRRTRLLALDIVKDLLYSAYMAATAPRADIVVTNTFWFPILARLKPKIGAVVVCVNRFPKGQLDLYENARCLQAVSHAVANAIVEQHPDAAPRVRVIPNPIDAEVFRPPACARRRRHERVVLYTGRIHPEKGPQVLIEAIRLLLKRRPDLRLRVKVMGQMRVDQGGGGPAFVDALREKAAGLPIELLEPVYGRTQLAEVLQDADYYIYPSLADKGESFGVAPLEAMATGLPVIVSGLECFRDFVVHGETGLIFDHRRPDSALQLSAALELLLDDDSLAERLGSAASRKAEEFAYPRVAAMFLDEFRSLIDGTGSPGRGSPAPGGPAATTGVG